MQENLRLSGQLVLQPEAGINPDWPNIVAMNLKWKIAQALEKRWWRLYLRRQSPEDYLHRKRDYWRRVLASSDVELPEGGCVLDAGCGPAGIFIILEEQRVDAVDPLLDAYERELDHFSSSWYPWVRFHAVPLEQFERRERYDVVFCLNALNHVADLERAADRLVGALKPGGQLLVSVDVHRRRSLKKLFQWIPGDILHPHQYDLEDYLKLLEERACKIRLASALKPGSIFDYFLMVAEKEG